MGGARRTAGLIAALTIAGGLAGCNSVAEQSVAFGSGLASAAIADAVTDDANVKTGIGLGVNAATTSGLKALQKTVHKVQQDQIAAAGGPLQVGGVARWSVVARGLEGAHQGEVTVSRLIQAGGIDCKELVFSVESGSKDQPKKAFYTTTVCRDGEVWRWAAAEPATKRWGALQ